MRLRRLQSKKTEMLSPSDVAKFVGCHPNTVRGWIRNGEIEYHRNPRNRYITISKHHLVKFMRRVYGVDLEEREAEER